MLSLRDFWRRHKRKAFVTTGVLGGGYLLYKLYNAHQSRLNDLERELADEREKEELIKTQLSEIKTAMQAHFENIQSIADTTTLPHAMRYLSDRVAEEVDLSHLTERLMKEKGQRNTLTTSEKLELWDKLKIMSFTKMVLSLWAMTMLSLYIRVQVNILGRHLYIDTASILGSSRILDEDDLIVDRDDQQKFLASSDFLSSDGMVSLISDMHLSVTEVLKGKKLGDTFNTAMVHETIMQILDTFMSMRSAHHWVDYLMPEDSKSHRSAAPSSSGDDIPPEATKFDQLMSETRAVLLSAEFGNVADISLKAVVDALVEDMANQTGGGSLVSGMPLARLFPRVAHMGPTLLVEPSENRFISIIKNVPEVELFFTLLYASIGA